jgi:hypothetical protein
MMGLFDSFNLPKINNPLSGMSSVSYAVGNAATKISEVASSTLSTMGSIGPFSKLGASLPSFASMTASALKSDSVLAGGAGALVSQQIASDQAALEGQASASSVKAAAGVNSTVTSDHLISLSDGAVTLEFDVMPEVIEARTVSYEPVAPAQFPGAFQKYKGTDSVQWTLNVTLIARNTDEATKNLVYLNELRGWTMPYFGDNTATAFKGKLGAPPPVLTLKGLRKYIIGPVPVVITSLNWNWPRDVDYLPTSSIGDDGNPVPFPAVMSIAIQLVESFSTTQFNQFDLSAYKQGDMDKAYNFSRIKGRAGTEGLSVSTATSSTPTVPADTAVTTPDAAPNAATTESTGSATTDVPVPVAKKQELPEGYTRDPVTGLVRDANGNVDRSLSSGGSVPDKPTDKADAAELSRLQQELSNAEAAAVAAENEYNTILAEVRAWSEANPSLGPGDPTFNARLDTLATANHKRNDANQAVASARAAFKKAGG